MHIGDLDELKRQLELHRCILEHDEPYLHERLIECDRCIKEIDKAPTIETDVDNLIKLAGRRGYENGYRDGKADGYTYGYSVGYDEHKNRIKNEHKLQEVCRWINQIMNRYIVGGDEEFDRMRKWALKTAIEELGGEVEESTTAIFSEGNNNEDNTDN